ncbi:DUF5723 family protein [Algoriphagus halophytocola]|uniref:DUF5723 family protein n=1 Tax=Algoriphagus halophytocola TaxID=2991499 RepID=A0ABY6MEI6_9BACT|nr:DUF5723 family protein [Algoriphagus sp. TR-M5]UZD22191.1 DUF5723 family protein [Algoriphagus sp. TR-M5]
MKSFFKWRLFSLTILWLIGQTTLAQTFIGSTVDNQAGVHSLLLNPALAVDSKMRLDINLISSSAFIGNDYLSIDMSDLDSFQNGFELNTDGDTNPTDNNNFFGNVDVLGPSILFNLDQKNSLAFTTRVRGFFNLNNIGGDLYELANTEYNEQTDFSVSMEDASGLIHAWAEIGASYARIILDDENQSLKAGLTLKYLAGAGGVYGESQLLTAQYSNQTDLLTTSGELRYGYTSGFDSDDINFSDIKSGFGADIGVVYEIKEQNVNTYYNPYKFRFGVSVMDIGAINYEQTTRSIYNMDNTIDANEFDNKDLDEILEDNFNGVEALGRTKMGLPTSLQFFGDYNINGSFFVSAQGAISLKKNKENPVSHLINSFTLTPRFERRWVSVYSPLSIRQYDSSLAWGIGVRAGPLMIGSGSIVSNLISNNSKSTDLYVGLKVPIYK